jgi:delta8-fatty-acid desaturase
MALARFNLYAQSWMFVVGVNSHTHPVKPRRGLEAISLLGFLGWMSWMCSILPSTSHIIVFLLVSHAIAGLLHVQITISHFSMETYDERRYKDDSECWLKTQLATTMDVDCPDWLDWFHIGLQFQIEHHLFPRIPRHNLRKVQSLMIPFCKKHGIHHHNVPWIQSVKETMACLRKVADKASESAPYAVRFSDTVLYAGLQAEG